MPADKPEIVTQPDPVSVREQCFAELWPVGGDPLKVRIVATLYHDGTYKTLRGSSWNLEVRKPQPDHAMALIEVYDLLEERLQKYGPELIKSLLEKLAA